MEISQLLLQWHRACHQFLWLLKTNLKPLVKVKLQFLIWLDKSSVIFFRRSIYSMNGTPLASKLVNFLMIQRSCILIFMSCKPWKDGPFTFPANELSIFEDQYSWCKFSSTCEPSLSILFEWFPIASLPPILPSWGNDYRHFCHYQWIYKQRLSMMGLYFDWSSHFDWSYFRDVHFSTNFHQELSAFSLRIDLDVRLLIDFRVLDFKD